MQVTSATNTAMHAAAAASSSSAANVASSSAAPNSTLSETQFLQLLTEQLQNQDPLQPQTDTEFLSQMAQFTALQETDTLNKQVQNLTAGSYIGDTVTVNPGNSQMVTGKVTGIDTSGALPQLVINGSEYPLTQLQMVSPGVGATAASSPAASQTPASSAARAVASLLSQKS